MKVQMKSICKSFGPVLALDNVDFSTEPGEVHGLLGENGAGKTTLMNVLSGNIEKTSGEIYIDDQLIEDINPRKASEMGLRFIHQELNLCNDLKVYENMFLGEEIKHKTGFVNNGEMIKRCSEVFERMQVKINPESVVEDLETSHKQLVEIARALLFKSELIIMDEPTTALNNSEIESLFSIIRSLKNEGVTFIYISHKMPELFEICDRYTVMRDGKFIESGNFADIDEHKATELLVGRALVNTSLKDNFPNLITDEVVLSVDNVSGANFSDVTFDLRRGEVISITGLQGSGAGDLAECLFGIQPISSGEIKLRSNTIPARYGILDFMKNGIAMVPRNRKERGILTELSIYDNSSMAYFTSKHKKPFINNKEEISRYQRNKEKLNIKANDPKLPITSLSGGNQQKVILGRWLEIDADVYILDFPTQGIDVGAKYEIYKLILSMAQQGKGILVFSTEFPEIAQISDKCMVMYKGEINSVIDREDLDEVKMMYFATGANQEGARHE